MKSTFQFIALTTLLIPLSFSLRTLYSTGEWSLYPIPLVLYIPGSFVRLFFVRELQRMPAYSSLFDWVQSILLSLVVDFVCAVAIWLLWRGIKKARGI